MLIIIVLYIWSFVDYKNTRSVIWWIILTNANRNGFHCKIPLSDYHWNQHTTIEPPDFIKTNTIPIITIRSISVKNYFIKAVY